MGECVTSPGEPVISIIDDDKPLGEALRRMLMSHGFTAINFTSAREFLAAEHQTETACMLLDVRMPEMSGIAFHEHLISTGRHIPVILMTARPSTGERTKALANGAVSYLAKPLSENILLDTVRTALESRAQLTGSSAARDKPRS
jgi:FixJ family two-component response regulator